MQFPQKVGQGIFKKSKVKTKIPLQEHHNLLKEILLNCRCSNTKKKPVSKPQTNEEETNH